ncbi:alanine--tRNA ligase [Coprothermobacteraceae bacterium]|nr:alanine--tRNA ligase [Coprothermobacteraceae bacterium]
MYMSSDEIRERFLNYFKERGHLHLPSSSLIPDDPTLLFTSAGMVQFKPYFLGQAEPPATRITTVQKCLRTGDLENVGKTSRHHTFFEMLGNFSVGDYFKKEAIPWAWDLVTKGFGLPEDRLWVTIYEEDDEAFEIWNKVVGVPAERIVRMGKEDNFWGPPGPTGPCGPCSEIYYDMGEEWPCDDPSKGPAATGERFREFWNLVFMQYYQDENGNLTELPKKNIDTGLGLERMAAILQEKPTNFDTDLFEPIMKALENLTGKTYAGNEVPFRVIADHIRALTFAITDGVVPSNEGRGYVIRRILRRAVRFRRKLGKHEPFLYQLVPVVTEKYGPWYPELRPQQELVMRLIRQDEEAFLRTLENSYRYLEELVEDMKAQGLKEVPADEIFKLYDTYGLPVDIIEDVLTENELTLDKAELDRIMEEYKEKSRSTWKGGEAMVRDTVYGRLLGDIETEFIGYDEMETESRIIATIKGDELSVLREGDEGVIVTEETPFYAESGGQEADKGVIHTETGVFEVQNVQKVLHGKVIAHYGKVVSGFLAADQWAHLHIDENRRRAMQRAHTATHLLHAALRQVLGDHVRQSGSWVGPDRFRFDFSHFQAMTPEEIAKVEELVNEQILANKETHIFYTTLEKAKELGAMALFGEKYGEQVRVVAVPGWSTELCGGTHAERTGDIGLFKIIVETASSQGIRRIEAVTGMESLKYMWSLEQLVKSAADALETSKDMVLTKIEKLLQEMKEKDKYIKKLRDQVLSAEGKELFMKAAEIGGIKFIDAIYPQMSPDSLVAIMDAIRSFNKPFVAALGSVHNDRPIMVMACSQDLTEKLNLKEILNVAAAYMGGKGGGRPTLVQAGGTDASRLPVALQQGIYEAKRRLGLE